LLIAVGGPGEIYRTNPAITSQLVPLLCTLIVWYYVARGAIESLSSYDLDTWQKTRHAKAKLAIALMLLWLPAIPLFYLLRRREMSKETTPATHETSLRHDEALALRSTYSEWTTEALLRASTTDKDQYRAEALDLIRQELSKRPSESR
jgi:hypothetical protein